VTRARFEPEAYPRHDLQLRRYISNPRKPLPLLSISEIPRRASAP